MRTSPAGGGGRVHPQFAGHRQHLSSSADAAPQAHASSREIHRGIAVQFTDNTDRLSAVSKVDARKNNVQPSPHFSGHRKSVSRKTALRLVMCCFAARQIARGSCVRRDSLGQLARWSTRPARSCCHWQQPALIFSCSQALRAPASALLRCKARPLAACSSAVPPSPRPRAPSPFPLAFQSGQHSAGLRARSSSGRSALRTRRSAAARKK